MKKLMIAAAVVAGFVGLASAVQAHRVGQGKVQTHRPDQGKLECPSTKNWAKCLWQEQENRGG